MKHLFVGSGARLYRDHILSRLGDLASFVTGDRNLPMASTVARMAQWLLPTHAEGDIARLVPRYVRPSDAELKILPPDLVPTGGDVGERHIGED
jgi:tRNA threonylcarbamoyladenosine biosynthesis protein TsaB